MSDEEDEIKNQKKGRPNCFACLCCCCNKRRQTTCTKNCEWKGFQFLCIATWVVIIAILVIGIVFFASSCNSFVKISPSIIGNGLQTWICVSVYLCFCLLTAVLFLIFTKCQCGSGCCCIYGCLWFILHILIGAITVGLIYMTPVPSWKDLLDSYKVGTNNGKPPKWFIYIQQEEFCCFNGTNGQLGVDKAFIQHCTDAFVNGTYSSHVVTCISIVKDIYEDCLRFSLSSCHVLLVLGVIPFTVYCCVYQRVKKFNALSPNEEQEDEKSLESQEVEAEEATLQESSSIFDDAQNTKVTENDGNRNEPIKNAQGETGEDLENSNISQNRNIGTDLRES